GPVCRHRPGVARQIDRQRREAGEEQRAVAPAGELAHVEHRSDQGKQASDPEPAKHTYRGPGPGRIVVAVEQMHEVGPDEVGGYGNEGGYSEEELGEGVELRAE